MNTVKLDTGTIIELREIGFNSLPNDYNYVVPDYIWKFEVDEGLQNEFLSWAEASGANLEVENVEGRIDFKNPTVAAQYGIDIVTDINGNFVSFPPGSQLGDATFRYLGEQGELYTSNGVVLLTTDSDVIELSRFYNDDRQGSPATLVEFFNQEVADGRMSGIEYEQIADDLHRFSENHYPNDSKYRVLPDDVIDSLKSAEVSGTIAIYKGIEISPGLLTTAAIGAGALKHAGFAGDVFEISLAVSKANSLLENNDAVGAEAIYFNLAGSLAGGAAVGSAAVIAAGGLLAGTGVGVVPGALILLTAGLAGSVGGSYLGEQIAGNLHSYAVAKLNNGDPLILDDLVSFYHTELKNEGIYHEAILSQALVGINTAKSSDVQEAFFQAVLNNPDLAEDRAALEQALRDVLTNRTGIAFENNKATIIDNITAIVNSECFAAGTLVDMWPLDLNLSLDQHHGYDQVAVRDRIWQKAIERVGPDDLVVAFGKNGALLPGRVTRTFVKDVKVLLDFHGTKVTPGHVYYRADSRLPRNFETLIDVLRDDGVIQHQDGTLIRAATNVPVGHPLDGFVWAITGERRADGNIIEHERRRIRLGTRFPVGNGRSYCIADLIKAGRGQIGEDEMIRVGEGAPMAFHWEFSDTLPKPEDFVLACSGVTLAEIYKAAEWEGQRPHLPAPQFLEAGATSDGGPYSDDGTASPDTKHLN